MKEAWKNNNTLIKFKEATPIEQRDEIADFQRSYDAKWKEPGSRSAEFNQKLVDRKVNRIIDSINKSNLITNIDSKYFSDNIRNMLMDYEREMAKVEIMLSVLILVNLLCLLNKSINSRVIRKIDW